MSYVDKKPTPVIYLHAADTVAHVESDEMYMRTYCDEVLYTFSVRMVNGLPTCMRCVARAP